ncbi:helix-turn-helix domain-containing protein [Nocardia sp. 2]|uniref:Helix-turn-helix domain-containing protein n=1 Tax=Nocardia acididurans TaxID=2802282 RepID=A0ABS1ME76_9NOCA|nr:PucR family transcriptional regulator [Nocardia acididurans]MBL1078400.1 helix-turn-helix domain-containing protein [Nocardia acididurans]
MRVRDILEAPRLRMRLLHGDTAALDRPVARVCATDMPDPRPFVTAGALVCTGLVWRRASADSDRYIGLLAGAGVAGVVAGQALHGHVPDDVVAACARHDLPLLSAPQSVPFSRLIEYLAERSADERWQRVRSGLERQRRLLAAFAAGADLPGLLADIAVEQEISAWILTSTGRVLAGTQPLSEAEIDRLVTAAVTAPRLPTVTDGAIRILQIGTGDRITAWYLAIRPVAAEPEPFGADLAAVAELYRQRAADRLRLDWELADRFPAVTDEWAAGEPVVAIVCEVRRDSGPTPWLEGEPAARYEGVDSPTRHSAAPLAAIRAALSDALHGITAIVPDDASPTGQSGHEITWAAALAESATVVPHTPATAVSPAPGIATSVAAGSVKSAGPDTTALAALGFSSAATGGATPTAGDSSGAGAAVVASVSTLLDVEGRIVALARGTHQRIAEQIRRRLERLAPALNGTRLAIGVGERRRGEHLSGAVAAARAAAVAARDAEDTVSMRVAEIDSAVGLFTAVPGGLQRRFAERVLGPVLDYDLRTGGGLLETLEVFLGCEGSWRQAAERMHLHLNTVRYRIGRVEELTGRDLGRLDDRLDLYLAVHTLAGQTAPV